MSVTTMLRGTKTNDLWCTPPAAVKALLPFLPKKSKILCPFDKGSSAFVNVLEWGGHTVHYSHIDINEREGYRSKDFFTWTPDEVKQYDFIISNPPFGKKDAVFEHLFALSRPFCMLMGATAGLFEGKRFNLWQKFGNNLSVIWLSPRVSYIDQNGVAMKSPPFQSCYVCWDVPARKRLGTDGKGHHFVRLEK